MVGLFLATEPGAIDSQAVMNLSPGAMEHVWLVPVLPFLAFCTIIFLTRQLRMVSALVSIGCLTGSFIIALAVALERLHNPGAPPQVQYYQWIVAGPWYIRLGVLVDNLSAMMLIVVTFIGTLIQIYSTGYMSHEPDFGFAKFFAYLSLFTASMLGLVLAVNFVQMYIFWEGVGLCSYLLIGFWYYKKSAADAAKKAFVVTRFGDLGFLMGILLIFKNAHGLTFAGPGNALHEMASLAGAHSTLVAVAAILIFCGAVGKSAQFPLHIWLPDAMEGPTPVSALIHAATMVAAGVYLVGRCFEMFQASPTALDVVAYIGALTAFMAATMGVVQNDIKRVMAYSTVSQLGYMFMALGIGTTGSFVAANFHLFTHAFFKALLFLCCGSAIHAVGSNDMWSMGGLRRYMPITAYTFLFGGLALSGIPPFAGFWSKDEILAAAVANHRAILAFAGYAAAFITAFYVARAWFVAFCGEYRGPSEEELAAAHAAHGGHDDHDAKASHDDHAGHDEDLTHDAPPKHAHEPTEPHENPLNMTLPLMILGVGAVGIGFVNAKLLGVEKFAEFVAHNMPETTSVAEPGVAWLLLSIALAALGWIVAYSLYGKEPAAAEARLKSSIAPIWTLLTNKYYMDDIWAFLLRNTMFLGANICDWFDRTVVDGFLVAGTGRAAFGFGRMLREEHSGKVQQYGVMIVVAVLILAFGVGVAELKNYALSQQMQVQQTMPIMMHGGRP